MTVWIDENDLRNLVAECDVYVTRADDGTVVVRYDGKSDVCEECKINHGNN